MCVRILSEFASTRDRQRFKSARARVDNMFRPAAPHRASRDVRTRRTREMQCGVSGAGFSGLIRVSEKASGVAIFRFLCSLFVVKQIRRADIWEKVPRAAR
jgi:hypothetical protein